MSPITIVKAEPAFRKWTPAVQRGILYLIACGEFDAKFDLIDTEKGGPIEGMTTSGDIGAAAQWLRHQYESRNKTDTSVEEPA